MAADDVLNIFEQRPVWERLVMNAAMCYQLPEETDTRQMIEKLQDALDRLVDSFPWLAGTVITEGRDLQKGNSGVVRIVHGREKPKITVKDYRQAPAVPDVQQLKESGYACAMLDDSIFAPRPAFVLIPSKEKPVLLIQASIISGGLVLVFSGCHATMDMPGQGQVMRCFSKACHNLPFTPAELEVGNMSRRNLIPLLDSTYEPGEELALQIPPTPTAGLLFPRVPSQWATFKISRQAVDDIKAAATATRTSAFVSTDDSLSAFIWQSVARVRTQRLSPDTISKAVRTVDVRQALGIPRDYPGLVQNNLFHMCSLKELSELPLGAVASKFRDALTRTSPSLTFYTRALATALSRTSDKSSLRITSHLDLSSDLIITSSVSSGAYHLDFALGLGPPEAVRLTHQITFESMVYLLPPTPNGDIAIIVCLRNEDIAALRADGSFNKYARYTG